MEKLLIKLARQLDALDEASLMNLWGKYAALTSAFEPTKRWEESALIFSLIQAKHWKNQLFNYNWALQSKPAPIPEAEIGRILSQFKLETDANKNDDATAEANKKEQETKQHICRKLDFKLPKE